MSRSFQSGIAARPPWSLISGRMAVQAVIRSNGFRGTIINGAPKPGLQLRLGAGGNGADLGGYVAARLRHSKRSEPLGRSSIASMRSG
jgi:hypothetical protein